MRGRFATLRHAEYRHSLPTHHSSTTSIISVMSSTLQLLAAHSTWLVFVVTLAARLGAPLPAAPLLVVVGSLAVTGAVDFWPAMIASVIANLLGDAAWFYAGKRFGNRMLRLLCRISISPDSCVRQSEDFIHKWGGSSLIAAKFIPGISVVAAPMAGALGMPLRIFFGYDVLAASLWTFGFAVLGLVFSKQLDRVITVLSGFGAFSVALVLAVLGAYLAYRWVRRRRLRREGAMPRIHVDELAQLIASGSAPLIIDVRSATSRLLDPRHIPGAHAIELKQAKQQFSALSSELASALASGRRLVIYCNCPNDASAAHAARLLMEGGAGEAMPLDGGLDAWIEAGHPIELRHAPGASNAPETTAMMLDANHERPEHTAVM